MRVFYFYKMLDYIVVGAGLAGIAFAEEALSNHKSIHVFENNSFKSSQTAAGVYNPVILKRFSGLAHADEHLALMHEFFDRLLAERGIDCNYKIPVKRRFASVEEQNNWFAAADKPALAGYLSTEIQLNSVYGIKSGFGFGEVLQTGFVNTENLLHSYRKFLQTAQLLSRASFEYSDIKFEENSVRYGDLQTRHIVFAEGFGLHGNPFFNHLPLDGTKGEVLLVKIPDFKLDFILKGNVFVLPMGDDLYKIGATYNWEDKTASPTPQGRQELIENLKELIELPFEVIGHEAAVRPTVKDRKPLLGTHSKHKQLHILNGLGTRGVMLGPALARTLYNSIENDIPIPMEYSISRFKNQP